MELCGGTHVERTAQVPEIHCSLTLSTCSTGAPCALAVMLASCHHKVQMCMRQHHNVSAECQPTCWRYTPPGMCLQQRACNQSQVAATASGVRKTRGIGGACCCEPCDQSGLFSDQIV